MTGDGPVAASLGAARAAYLDGRYGDACRLFAAVVAGDGGTGPAAAPPWIGLGDARWKRGDRDGAIAAYERATKADPTDSRAWHNLATALLAARRFPEAARAAGTSVGLRPTRAKAWNNLAAARDALGDPAGAEEALVHAVEADPGFAAAWENLGWLRVEQGGCVEAEDAFRRAAEPGRVDASIDRGLARCLVGKGDLAGAESRLSDAVRSSPSRVDLWLDLADVRRRQSKTSQALDAFEAALGAASDMGSSTRASVARRTRDAALLLVREAVVGGDRRAFAHALERARAAHEQGGPALDADEDLRRTVDGIVAAAASAGREELSPAEVSALVRSRLRVSPPGERGGRA